MSGFLEQVEQLDHELLLAVNETVGHPWPDTLMVLASEKWVWIPLYAALLLLLWKRIGSRSIIFLFITVTSMVVMTDQGSVVLFKNVFERFRPCHHLELQSVLALPSGRCGGLYGFVSSHASNVFGLAAFVFLLMKEQSRWWILLFLWAAMVSFSRVYLAVHYPADVVAGAVFGIVCGMASHSVFIKTIAPK